MKTKPVVLIFSSEQERIDLFQDSAASCGAECHGFTTADELLNSVYTKTASAVIIDHTSESMGAYMVCNATKDHPDLQSSKKLVITDIDDPIVLDDFISMGVDDFLLEPCSTTEIDFRINHLLPSEKSIVNVSAATLSNITNQIAEFDLIGKVDTIKTELCDNTEKLMDEHDKVKVLVQKIDSYLQQHDEKEEDTADAISAVNEIYQQLSRAEFGLQFTDRVAQQVNEVGKLIYHIHLAIRKKGSVNEGGSKEETELQQSSTSTALEQIDRDETDAILSALNL